MDSINHNLLKPTSKTNDYLFITSLKLIISLLTYIQFTNTSFYNMGSSLNPILEEGYHVEERHIFDSPIKKGTPPSTPLTKTYFK